MSTEYGKIILRNMRVARRFDYTHGEWPKRRFADALDSWMAWAGVAVVLLILVIDVARHGL